uniref:Uncharacterized protein n=1 Tax=Physcomitrium patens TaxID=3218 RepID=A0A7I4ESJ0_PHYPA
MLFDIQKSRGEIVLGHIRIISSEILCKYSLVNMYIGNKLYLMERIVRDSGDDFVQPHSIILIRLRSVVFVQVHNLWYSMQYIYIIGIV